MKDRSELFNTLYEKLRHLARGKLVGENGGNARGDATSLVHEAYLKLRSWSQEFENDAHFLATVSSAMRQVLIDRARARQAQKRGAKVEPLSIALEGPLRSAPTVVDVLLLDETLERLAAFDRRAAQITEMRVFLGLSEEEIASGLGISTRTVKRDWAAAKAWLQAEMETKERNSLEEPGTDLDS
ncbi:MAG: ECF-type sigma factor [Bryobacteraceae bacterium]|jgi:RNA polymerase sigma factor (TIGR02999 family)